MTNDIYLAMQGTESNAYTSLEPWYREITRAKE